MRNFALIVVLIFLAGCAQGLRKETQALAEASVANTASFRLLNDMAVSAQAMRFKDDTAKHLLTQAKTDLQWKDNSCTTNSGPLRDDLCALKVVRFAGRAPVEIAEEKSITAPQVYAETINQLNEAYRDLASITGAGSVTVAQETIANVKTTALSIAMASSAEATKNLEKVGTESAEYAQAKEWADNAEKTATQIGSQIEFSAGILSRWFEKSLVKKQNEAVRKAAAYLLLPKNESNTTLGRVSGYLGDQGDALIDNLIVHWISVIRHDFDEMREYVAAQRLDPDQFTEGSGKRIENTPEYAHFQSLYARLDASRTVMLALKRLQFPEVEASCHLLKNNKPKVCQCRQKLSEPVPLADRKVVNGYAYSHIMRRYEGVTQNLLDMSDNPKGERGKGICIGVFKADAQAFLKSLSSLEQLMAARMRLERDTVEVLKLTDS